MTLIAVDDLMFGSKIRAAADHAGADIACVRSRDDILPTIRTRRPSLVIFDLDRESLDPIGAIRAVRADDTLKATRLVAFVRHTSTDLIAAARAAGIDQVLARSAFFPALPALLGAGEAAAAVSARSGPSSE